MGEGQGRGNEFARRQFVRGAAGAAAAVGVGGPLAGAQSAGAHTGHAHAAAVRRHGLPPKIDVHAHFLPPGYREALIANGQAQPDGFPILPTWSPERPRDARPGRHPDGDAVRLVAGRRVRRGPRRVGAPGERGGCRDGARPPGSLRALRVPAGTGRRRRAHRGRVRARPAAGRRDRAAHERRRRVPRRRPLRAALGRAAPPQGGRLHPPDVACVLGGDLARLPAPDDGVPHRHDARGRGPRPRRDPRAVPGRASHRAACGRGAARARRPARGLRDAVRGWRPGAGRDRRDRGARTAVLRGGRGLPVPTAHRGAAEPRRRLEAAVRHGLPVRRHPGRSRRT